jgi:hypothetical protein
MTLEFIISVVFGILTGIFIYNTDFLKNEDKVTRIGNALIVAAWWPLFWFIVALIQIGQFVEIYFFKR